MWNIYARKHLVERFVINEISSLLKNDLVIIFGIHENILLEKIAQLC